jgi:hypothetical protein
MFLCTLRDHGNDPGGTEFRAFFDRPLHAIEFEDGDGQREICNCCLENGFAKLKFHPAVLDGDNPRVVGTAMGNNIEFLIKLGAKNARQMIGVRTGQSGMVTGNFVGNPAAACHGNIVTLL